MLARKGKDMSLVLVGRGTTPESSRRGTSSLIFVFGRGMACEGDVVGE